MFVLPIVSTFVSIYHNLCQYSVYLTAGHQQHVDGPFAPAIQIFSAAAADAAACSTAQQHRLNGWKEDCERFHYYFLMFFSASSLQLLS